MIFAAGHEIFAAGHEQFLGTGVGTAIFSFLVVVAALLFWAGRKSK